MTFVQLRYILTIAETKSMNKAAELLYVSQPSLTNAVKETGKGNRYHDLFPQWQRC